MPNLRSAKGIPNRDQLGDLTTLQAGQLLDWYVQHHKAYRAGPHYDVRFGTPQTGLFSWAVPRGLPEPGSKHLALQQPIHAHSYGSWEGEIPRGKYGGGTVTSEDVGKVLVDKVEPDKISFTVAHKKQPERYVLIKPKGMWKTDWLLINTTPTQPIEYTKQRYTTVDPKMAETVLSSLAPGSTVQAKVDGAASLTQLLRDKPEISSYRVSKLNERPIIHTERVFGKFPQTSIPKELEGTILRGELYGERNGQAIPPQELGGILNSSVANALQKQKRDNVQLKNMVFDVHRLGQSKMDINTPYDQRMEMLKTIMKYLPSDTFTLPQEAHTPEESLRLFKNIQSGGNALTREGVVVHPATGRPFKIKFGGEHDVIFHSVFPGEGKYTGTGAGGFHYTLSPDGPVIGKVGTGLSDEMRRELYQNSDMYKGRTVRIKAQEQLPSGAFRAPVFHSFHEDYPTATQPTSPDLLKAAASVVYGGDDASSPIPREQLESYINKVQTNTGLDLQKMPLITGKQNLLQNVGRYYFPKTVRQIPSRAMHWLNPIKAVRDIREEQTIEPASYYNRDFGTVNVNHVRPAVVGHEIGHYADFDLGKGPAYKSTIFNPFKDYKNSPYPDAITAEVNATTFARQAMGEKDWKRDSNFLTTALASYLYGTGHEFQKPNWDEWWRGDKMTYYSPHWKRTLPKMLQESDVQLRRESLRRAINSVARKANLAESPEEVPISTDRLGRLRWTDPKSKDLVTMARMILDAENQRVRG
jgi:hypothetical protein